MTRPEAGVTHDIVLHVNNSIQCGLILMPGTFAIRHASTFIPRMSVGDLSGLDTSRWKSFVQKSFMQGAGQYKWSSAHANGGFSSGEGLEIGKPFAVGQDMILTDDPPWALGENLQPYSRLQLGHVPVNTSCVGGYFSAYAHSIKPSFVFEMSKAPHMVYDHMITMFTVPNPAAWVTPTDQDTRPIYLGGFVNVTPVIATADANHIVSAVYYSGCIISATRDSGLRVYGSSNGALPAYVYEPTYSTHTSLLKVYDEKVWRVNNNKLSYLREAYNTIAASWSDEYAVDNPTIPVTNLEVFGGQLYLGKQDGLYIFDAGRVYQVQSYEAMRNESNFSLMTEHQGALYYNIGNILYRITTGGVIERLRTPVFGHDIQGGVSFNDEVYFLVTAKDAGRRECNLWTFAPETGSVRESLDLYDRTQMASPININACLGYMWLSPCIMTNAVWATNAMSHVAAFRPIHEDQAPRVQAAHVVTSRLDMGIPSLDKVYNAVKVTHVLPSPSSKILVYRADENVSAGVVVDEINLVTAAGSSALVAASFSSIFINGAPQEYVEFVSSEEIVQLTGIRYIDTPPNIFDQWDVDFLDSVDTWQDMANVFTAPADDIIRDISPPDPESYSPTQEIVCSVNGRKVFMRASDIPTSILYSDDFGASWTEIIAPITFDNIGINSDGSKLYGTGGDNLYYTDDYGETWTSKEVANIGSTSEFTYRLTVRGSQILVTAGTVSGGLEASFYLSDDDGVTWTQIGPVGGTVSGRTDISTDGQYISIPVLGSLYVSSDYGASFTQRAISNEGPTVIADDGTLLHYSLLVGLELSTDFGASWTDISPGAASISAYIAISLDASKLYCRITSAGSSYVSTDSGTTWTELEQQYDDKTYYYGALNSAGTVLYVGYGGYVGIVSVHGPWTYDLEPSSPVPYHSDRGGFVYRLAPSLNSTTSVTTLQKFNSPTTTQSDVASYEYLGKVEFAEANPKIILLDEYQARDIAFKFEVYGDGQNAARLEAYEVEYMPIGPKYLQAGAVVAATDKIEIGNMEVENSGAFVRATIFSCAASQLPYVFELPFPTVGHTILAQVTITPPGANPPVLGYDEDIGATIPITIDEL